MKKALIIANMLFASATVWGMIPTTELNLNSRSYYSQKENILRKRYIDSFDELINDWENNNSDKVLNDLVKDYVKHGVKSNYRISLLMRACQLRKYDLVPRILECYQGSVPLADSVDALGNNIILTVL